MATKIVCDRCGNETSQPILEVDSLHAPGRNGPEPHPSTHPARMKLLLSNGTKKPGRDWQDKDLCPECLDELSRWMDLPKRTKATGRTK